jgi:hypothetical protein
MPASNLPSIGEVTDYEVVMVRSSRMACLSVVSQPEVGVQLPQIFRDIGGHPVLLENQRSKDSVAKGPRPRWWWAQALVPIGVETASTALVVPMGVARPISSFLSSPMPRRAPCAST